MAFLPSIRDLRFRPFSRIADAWRDASKVGNRQLMTQVVAAPMIAVSILSLVCLGLLADLSTQSAQMRRVVDLDLDNAVALARLDRELSQLEIATATGRLTPDAAQPQIVALKVALEGDALRDDPALPRLRHNMADLMNHADKATEVRNLRTTILSRLLDARNDAEARADAMEAAIQRSTVLGMAGALLAVLLGAVAASVSLHNLQKEYAAVARIAHRMVEQTIAQRRR